MSERKRRINLTKKRGAEEKGSEGFERVGRSRKTRCAEEETETETR